VAKFRQNRHSLAAHHAVNILIFGLGLSRRRSSELLQVTVANKELDPFEVGAIDAEASRHATLAW
jgi:hypothetical protein